VTDFPVRWVPKGKDNEHILGRIVDVKRTAGGIELAGDQIRNVTTMVLVDVVGEGVDRCKVGDVILQYKCSHVWLRNGYHVVAVKNDEVICVVEGLDFELVEIEGDKRARPTPGNGRLVTT
jgi:hypothetical protein